MRNPRNQATIRYLALEIMPGPQKMGLLYEIYREATKSPYSYLLLDFHAMQGSLKYVRTCKMDC